MLISRVMLLLLLPCISGYASSSLISGFNVEQDDSGSLPRVSIEVLVDDLTAVVAANVKFWHRAAPELEWELPRVVKHSSLDKGRKSFIVNLGHFDPDTEISFGAFLVDTSGQKIWNNGEWNHYVVKGPDLSDGCVATDLTRAAGVGDAKAVKAYLENAQGPVNFKLSDSGKTALHVAFAAYAPVKRAQYDEVLRLLLNAGADPRIKDAKGRSVADMIESDNRVSMDIQNLIVNKKGKLDAYDRVDAPFWSTELMYAAEACDVQRLERLLKEGVDPNFQNPMSGKTALHFALSSMKADKIQCANLLLSYGASPFIRDFGNRKGPGVSVDETLRYEDGFLLHGRTAMEIIQHANARASFEGLNLRQPAFVCQTQSPTKNGRAVLNELFDGIYVLNLAESESGNDRFEKFQHRIKPLGSFKFERFPGVYFSDKYGKNPGFIGDGINNEAGKRYDFKWFIKNRRVSGIGELGEGTLMGQIGVTLGHLQIIKKAKAEGKSRILIFEDDIAFSNYFIEATKTAIEELDRSEGAKWSMLYLDTNTRFLLHLMDVQKHKSVKRSYGMLMCSAWVINASAFDAIIKRLSDIFDTTKPPLPPIDVVLANEIQTTHDSYFVFPLPAYQDDGGFSQIGY